MILVVDDEIHMLVLYRKHLAMYKLMVSTSAVDAVQVLRHNKIDLLITDLAMPIMDGYALATFVKAKYEIPVIIVTALSAHQDHALTLADHVVVKPVRWDELKKIIATILIRKP